MDLLSKVKKYTKVTEKLFIFLPKPEIDLKKEYIFFPFFTKKESKYQLLFWMSLNINNFKYKIINVNEDVPIKETDIDIEFTQEETKNLIEDFGKIYLKYGNIIKENKENDINDFYDYLKRLKETLNKELYFLYFHEEKKEKETKESKKFVLQETGNDEYSVEELLKKFSEIKVNKEQKYIPELENETGLKFVSDKMLDIVYKMLSNGNIRSDYNDNEKREKVYV